MQHNKKIKERSLLDLLDDGCNEPVCPIPNPVGLRNGTGGRQEAEVYCDGASSGNPGNSGIGVVIRYLPRPAGTDYSLPRSLTQQHGKQYKVLRISENIGTATNNVAEYHALIRGLKEVSALGLKRINVFLDSELLVKQMTGHYKVRNNNLKSLWSQAQNILRKFDTCKIVHIRRELNREADLLAKKSIKAYKK